MNFNRSGHRDNFLFVIALLLPAVVAGARYFESDRQMTQIAQAQAERQSVAAASAAALRLRVADASGGRR
jgi:hypothetical protein